MSRRLSSGVLSGVAAATLYVGGSLAVGRGPRSLSPFPPMPVTGAFVMAFALLVLVPLAVVVPRRRRIAERLGIAPPRSGGRPDEDLGAGGPGGEAG